MSDTTTTNLQPVVDTIRVLAMDAVQKAESGHPGMPMGMADAAATLWARYLKFAPERPTWPDRDRFILSAGHGSMLLYSLLHLSGYDLPLSELKNFRQWGSHTPGHPEYGHTPGVETTTGPLGQGISNAVGMAVAERWLGEWFNRPDFPVVDHHTFVIASDGDLMEGVAHESAALAAHLGLGKLIVLYDDNKITIDGDTELAFTEDVPARFAAYGWHTDQINGHEREAVAAALDAALADRGRPSLIACRTTIGYGSPNKANTAGVHGSPLGAEEVERTRENLGLPKESFWTDPEAYAIMKAAGARGEERRKAWEELVDAYEEAYPELAAEFRRVLAGRLPAGWEKTPMPDFEGPMATRAASGKALNAFAARIPEMLGGSADLTGSNKTAIEGESDLTRDDFSGRYIRYGVREHGMGAMLSGMALHGGVIPYGGTFLIFSDYMRPTIRLAAMMGAHTVYVFTHDSIGLGEDGPTHQPIEHLASLRAIPNLVVLRPADAEETAVAWKIALERRDGPTALVLTRQKLPVLARERVAGVESGAYVLSDADEPQAILIATGSEVHIALEAQELLAEEGIAARVVSMPSWELFEAMPQAYRDQVLPPALKARVVIEAANPLGWERYAGEKGAILGLNRFGASAPYQRIYEELGLTPEAAAKAAAALVRG